VQAAAPSPAPRQRPSLANLDFGKIFRFSGRNSLEIRHTLAEDENPQYPIA
jgi:hypothetical protein